jgi:cytochrome c peroxidase
VSRSRIAEFLLSALVVCSFPGWAQNDEWTDHRDGNLDRELHQALRRAGFTGRVESTLGQRLGRAIDPKLANLGRLLWFDVAGGLHSDNTCGGCHSPTNGMGDTQSIAIGIQNNNFVGPHRSGPRNQRRTPTAANSAFYPKLMWNGRFSATSGDPFNNSLGFLFPPPEADIMFSPNDSIVTHLLIAQAHIPPTELVEVAGFTGTAGTIGPRFDIFDDNKGDIVPSPDSSGFRNEPIRQAVLERLNRSPSYRTLFGQSFPSVAAGGSIDFAMFGRAIAEFEFTLIFADAPVDRFTRGDSNAMTVVQKKGALLFFGKAGCISCHAVSGQSNEMFSDFEMHVAAVPQIAPFFGAGEGNVIFDGSGENEDFGLEQITGNAADRYKFRTSPLRNAALQPAFFHNGAFTKLKDAIRYHLDAPAYARAYDPGAAGVDHDLRYRLGPIEPVLARIDTRLSDPPHLSPDEFESLVAFVADGLLDSRAPKQNLCKLLPASVPSGLPVMQFEGCPPPK